MFACVLIYDPEWVCSRAVRLECVCWVYWSSRTANLTIQTNRITNRRTCIRFDHALMLAGTGPHCAPLDPTLRRPTICYCIVYDLNCTHPTNPHIILPFVLLPANCFQFARPPTRPDHLPATIINASFKLFLRNLCQLIHF